MKFSIECNSSELIEVIKSGTLLALAESASKVDVSALAAAKIIRHEKPSESEVVADKEPVQEPIKDAKPSTKANPEPEAPTKKDTAYTLVQVREKLTSLSKSGKQAEVKKLIEKFGASKLSEIKEEDYAALMQEAEGL